MADSAQRALFFSIKHNKRGHIYDHIIYASNFAATYFGHNRRKHNFTRHKCSHLISKISIATTDETYKTDKNKNYFPHSRLISSCFVTKLFGIIHKNNSFNIFFFLTSNHTIH